MKTTSLFCLLLALAACSGPSAGQGGSPKAGDVRKTGTIRFEVSCRPELKADFEAAVACSTPSSMKRPGEGSWRSPRRTRSAPWPGGEWR